MEMKFELKLKMHCAFCEAGIECVYINWTTSGLSQLCHETQWLPDPTQHIYGAVCVAWLPLTAYAERMGRAVPC
jgi:hypothetical protein